MHSVLLFSFLQLLPFRVRRVRFPHIGVQLPFLTSATELPPIPDGVIRMPPSSKLAFSWDVRLEGPDATASSFLEVQAELTDPADNHALAHLSVTFSNLEPNLSLDPVPLRDFLSNPSLDPANTFLSCRVLGGSSRCTIRKACNLPYNSSTWFILVRSGETPNFVSSFTLQARVGRLYIHPLELGEEQTVVHNPSVPGDFASTFDFLSLRLPLSWFEQMPYGTFLSITVRL